MATKNQKLFGSIAGAAAGGAGAHYWAKNNENIDEKDVIWYTLGGALLGALTGYGVACLLGSPNDTANYTHYNKKKRVYEGIAYEHRFDTRQTEHKASGKVFTRVVKDKPKTRSEALKLEKERILKYKPINNIHHNT